jgi:site-specific DNA-cytosine methylase
MFMRRYQPERATAALATVTPYLAVTVLVLLVVLWMVTFGWSTVTPHAAAYVSTLSAAGVDARYCVYMTAVVVSMALLHKIGRRMCNRYRRLTAKQAVVAAGVILTVASQPARVRHNVARAVQAVAFPARLNALPTATVTTLLDSAATNHITFKKSHVHTMNNNEMAWIEGMGNTVSTGMGDATIVLRRAHEQFTDPTDIHDVLIAPDQDVTLLSEGALESDGMYRDSVHRRLFTSDRIDGVQQNLVPLPRSIDGDTHNMFPVDMLFVDIDGQPFAGDTSPLADEYRVYLSQPNVNQRYYENAPVGDCVSGGGGVDALVDAPLTCDKYTHAKAFSNLDHANTSAGADTKASGLFDSLRSEPPTRPRTVTKHPYTFVDGFGGNGSISQVLASQGNQPVGHFDSDPGARSAYEADFPFVPSAGDVHDAMSDDTFTAAAAKADVVYATPPCRDYSTAGRQRGDTVDSGKLVYSSLNVTLSTLQPKMYVLETVPATADYDDGRIGRQINDIATNCTTPYVVQSFDMNPLDYGGCQHRPRTIWVLTRGDVYNMNGSFVAPAVTTPQRDATVRDVLDPPQFVDWNALHSPHEYRPTGQRHAPEYKSPRRDFITGAGGIGEGSFSIDGPACTLKATGELSPGGWTQCYYDDRTPECTGHRYLSVAECCRVMNLDPTTPGSVSTKRMLGMGVDGNVTTALSASISNYLQQFKTAGPKAYEARATKPSSPFGPNIPVELAHARGCHMGVQPAKVLGWEQMPDDFFCEVCPSGKTVHTDVNYDPVAKCERIGALLCGDILGPFCETKSGKFKYCAVFISAFGHVVHTYPMKRKSDFRTAFRHVCNEYRNNGTPVEKFMTDTDAVMTSEAFRDEAVRLCVSLRLSSPFCHWQNGVIERWVYTCKNKTICNLVASKLGECWWYPALRHAADTHNATPTKTNPSWASPRDCWKKNLVRGVDGTWNLIVRTDESFRRVFGCDAYVRRENRTSLQPRCDKCVFLGYAPDHADGTYDFYNIRTGRQITSRDVTFDERSVTPTPAHEYIRAEGMRTLPDWMVDDNPFQVHSPSGGTGPMLSTIVPLHSSDPVDVGATAAMPSGTTATANTGTNAGVAACEPVPQAPAVGVVVSSGELVSPDGHRHRLTKRERKNKNVKNPGIIRRAGKRSSEPHLHNRHTEFAALGVPGQYLLGRIITTKNGTKRPYNSTDLGYDLTLGYFQTAAPPVIASAHNAKARGPLDPKPATHIPDYATAQEAVYVDTITAVDVERNGVFSSEMRSAAAAVRDIDADARMVMQVIDVDANGNESAPTGHLFVSEYDTPEPNTLASYHSAKRDAPKRFKEMMQRDDKGQWIAARKSELLKLKDSWHYCDNNLGPTDRRPVRVHTLYTLKRHADGSVDRYKCRMVLDCSSMTKKDVGETFQHVAEMDSLHFMCANAAQFDLIQIQTDIEGAFLAGTPPSHMYCYPPEGERAPMGSNGRPQIKCVTGNVYGKLDAPRVYGQCYDNHLQTFPCTHGGPTGTTRFPKSLGKMTSTTVLTRGTADHSTWHFVREYEDGTVRRLDMLVYVDDNLSTFQPDSYGWQLHYDICDHINKRFKIQADADGKRDGAEAHSFLGCQVVHDWDKKTVALSMPAKVDAVLEVAGMATCNPKRTTGAPKSILRYDHCPKMGGSPCTGSPPYSSVCGAMLYIARMVRPDCMQRAAELARFMHSPGASHWEACKHLCQYLQGTRDESLVYRCDPNVTADTFAFQMYVDANHAPDHGHEYRNHKCTIGWAATQNNTALSWRSRTGPVLTDSSGASEFLAAADASKQAVYLRRMYADFGYPQHKPTPLFEDNESCEKLVKNYCGHDRIKHLDIRASVVREHSARGVIEMKRIPGPDQLADQLTKVTDAKLTERMRNWFLRGDVELVCSTSPISAG